MAADGEIRPGGRFPAAHGSHVKTSRRERQCGAGRPAPDGVGVVAAGAGPGVAFRAWRRIAGISGSLECRNHIISNNYTIIWAKSFGKKNTSIMLLWFRESKGRLMTETLVPENPRIGNPRCAGLAGEAKRRGQGAAQARRRIAPGFARRPGGGMVDRADCRTAQGQSAHRPTRGRSGAG